MSERATSRLIVGDGPVARALTIALTGAGEPPLRFPHARPGAEAHGTETPPRADVVIVAVRDEAIAEVAARLTAAMLPAPVLIHCAGALGAGEPFLSLKPAGVALLHPLASLARGNEPLAGVLFALQGDAAGLASARAIVERVRGTPMVLDPSADPALYHAACALVANHVVGLFDAALALYRQVGIASPETAAATLLASTAKNLAQVGVPDALTGPIARGDVAVVERHLRALAAFPELDALYRATALRVVKVAADKGKAAPPALERIRKLLDL